MKFQYFYYGRCGVNKSKTRKAMTDNKKGTKTGIILLEPFQMFKKKITFISMLRIFHLNAIPLQIFIHKI